MGGGSGYKHSRLPLRQPTMDVSTRRGQVQEALRTFADRMALVTLFKESTPRLSEDISGGGLALTRRLRQVKHPLLVLRCLI